MNDADSGITLTVRNIHKSFPGTNVLKGINCDIKAGTVFGIIGPNGSGKTTLLRILATVLRPTSGNFQMMGHSYPEDMAAIREIVGYSPDPLPIDWRVDAYDFLEFTARIYDRPASRIDEVLDLTGLKDEAFKKVKAYSKGMLKRLGFARILLVDPKVFLLDEPTSGLDPSGQKKVQNSILKMDREDRIILLSSNNLHEVARICDEVLFLKDGALSSVDSISETFEGEELYIVELILKKANDAFVKEALKKFEGMRLLSKNRNKVRFASQKAIKNEEMVDFVKEIGGEIEEIRIL